LLEAENAQFPGFVNLYAADARGVTVAFEPTVGPGGRPLLGLDFSDRPYYDAVRRTHSTVVTDVFAGRGGADEPLVGIVHPILVADTFAGFVAGALDLKQLPRPIPAPADSDRLRVADAAGMIVYDSERQYRPGDHPRAVRDTLAFAAVRASGQAGSTIVYQTMPSAVAPAAVAAARVIAGTAPLPALGGWVWVEHPFSRIEAAVAASYVRLLAVMLAIVVLSLFASNLLARWFAVPLLRVRAAAGRLAAGDLAARVGALPAVAPAEVAEMGRGFDEMATALEGRTEELEQLGEIARSLASTLDPSQLLHEVTDIADRLVGSDGCGIALLEDGGRTLRAGPYSSGLVTRGVGDELPLDGSLNGWVVRTGEPILVSDVGSDPRVYRQSLDVPHIGSAICAPLIGRSGTLGSLLAVRSRERARAFTPADLRLLERLARHVAIAVENARLLEAAHAASRAKSDFLATISHELRTPLNGVLGHLQILEMEIFGPLTPGQRETLTRINSATRHLRGLIEEVLAFSRLEAGRVPVRLGSANLGELVDEVAAVIEPLARQKQLGFHVELAAAAPVVCSDADKIRQILINLAGNAVKFTDAGEVRLRLGVDAEHEEARLAVVDTGPGIARADFARLFEPFVQLDGGLSRAHEGTGLGLYLSQKYAEMIGGRIEVESAPGRGSTFTLVLPCAAPAAALSVPPVSQPAAARRR
ncbi:MAG TPA: ATP-binding protein, partial [Longimicrobiaceae bacterium]|nr:ATP-binding protein [Longimicrobiaceae bacterium]